MGTITMRAENTFEELDNTLFFYTEEDLLAQLDDIEFADEPERTQLLPDLYRKLKRNGIPCEKRTDSDAVEYYRQIITEYYSDPKNQASFESRLVTALARKLSSYPTPADYLQRIADNCGDRRWKNDPLRLRILKQFIVYGDFLKAAYDTKKTDQSAWIKMMTNAENAEDAAKKLDDSIFDLYYSDKAAIRNHACEAIKIANELTSGIFWTNSVTIKPLYLLAICFGMTYAYESEDEVRLPDEKTDIRKNLFRGFYINNPIGEKTNGSAIPSERGINYSNYAEMAYLYYIANDCGGLTAAEKLRRAEAMIAAVGSAEKPPLLENRPTQYYVDRNAQFLRKSEKEAIKYLQEEFSLSCVLPTAIINNKSESIRAYLRGFIHSAYSGASEENIYEKISDDLIRIITESALNKIDQEEAKALQKDDLSSGKYSDERREKAADNKTKFQCRRGDFRNMIRRAHPPLTAAIRSDFQKYEAASQEQFQAVLTGAVRRVISETGESWEESKTQPFKVLKNYLTEPDDPELTLYIAGYTAQIFSADSEKKAPDAGVLADGIVNILENGNAEKLAENIRKFLPAAVSREQACDAVYNAVVTTFGVKTAPFSIRETQNTADGIFNKVALSLKEAIYNYENGDITIKIKESILSYTFSIDPLISEAVRMEASNPKMQQQIGMLLPCLRNTNSFFGKKSVNSVKNVTRSHLLVRLMYLFFYRSYEDTVFDGLETISLETVYFSFQAFAEPYLRSAFYEPVSQQRIFDILCCTALLLSYYNDRFTEPD